MRLCDVPKSELERMIQATERAVGQDARAVEILRRELGRREIEAREKRQEVPREDG